MSEVIARFGCAARIIETEDEIIFVGHQNAAGEFPEKRFPKAGHWVERNNNEILILKE